MRNLNRDLEICKAATERPWGPFRVGGRVMAIFGGKDGGINVLGVDVREHYSDGQYQGTDVFLKISPADLRFILEAAEGWEEAIQRAMSAETRVQELEAQAAVMQEALERIAAGRNGLGVDDQGRHIQPWEVAQKVLSSSAGCGLLEEMQELKAQAAALRDALDTISDFIVRLPIGSKRQEEAIKWELEKADKALSSSAGQDLLKRLKTAEAIIDVAQKVLDRLPPLPTDSISDKELGGMIVGLEVAIENFKKEVDAYGKD